MRGLGVQVIAQPWDCDGLVELDAHVSLVYMVEVNQVEV